MANNNNDNNKTDNRGFASMNPQKHREISSKGGQNSHNADPNRNRNEGNQGQNMGAGFRKGEDDQE